MLAVRQQNQINAYYFVYECILVQMDFHACLRNDLIFEVINGQCFLNVKIDP
jgi:hypothetical protein